MPSLVRALSLAVAITLTIGSPPHDGASAHIDRPDGPLVPEDGALFGTYLKPSAWDRETVQREFLEREREAGRTFDIMHWYYSWNDTFPVWREQWSAQLGRTPMVSWSGIDTRRIASGQEDARVRARARDVRQFGDALFLRWFWEMDGSANQQRAIAPDSYIAAWRRIHTIFQDEGASNAVFVWCPTAWGFTSDAATEWYPGDAYVDWVCADGYNWAPGRDGDPWNSFTVIYAAFHNWGMARGKPMMAGEFGVQERGPGEKAAWFRSVPEQLSRDLPGISAVVYFDSHSEYDWRPITSGESFEGYLDMVRHPYLNPTPTPPPPPPPSPDPTEPPPDDGGDDEPAVPVSEVVRVSGADRIETAIEVSRESYGDGEASTVVLARSDRFPDALAGTPLAVQEHGPLLLTMPSLLANPVRDEIRRVLPRGETVYLLGGSAALDARVAHQLRDDGYEVVRYAGATRQATAVRIAEGLGDPGALLLATGSDFPDALSAGAAAASVDGVVLLTSGAQVSDELASYLARHRDTPRIALGGPAARAVPDAETLVGTTRYETAVAAARRFFPESDVAGIASGSDFPDALSGGPHIARQPGPMLLTVPTDLPAATRAYLNELDTPKVYIYGGPSAIDDRVVGQLGR